MVGWIKNHMVMESEKRRRCELSAAVQEPELEVMDGRTSLAMTGGVLSCSAG